MEPIVIPDIAQEPRRLGTTGEKAWRIAGVIGVIFLIAGVAMAMTARDGWRSFFFAYLLAYAFVLSISLGALFFVMLQHLTRAGWSVVVRRLAEGVAAVMPVLAVLFLPLLAGLHELYHWSNAAAVASEPALRAKSAYLNVPFFVVRWVLYFAVWTLLARLFVRPSLAQDDSGDPELTLAMQRRSAPAMLAFALTTTFAAVDLIMSLDPYWMSTMFGVYFFAGSVVGFFAVLTLAALAAQHFGMLRHVITLEHYHDLGKLLFAFTVFWAYIAFSQYMLIWYTNLPEETKWFMQRQVNGWEWIGLTLVFGHFLLPFIVLLSRQIKRTPRLLGLAAVWMLAMHAVDLYWMIMPQARPARVALAPIDVAVFLGLAGVWLAAVVLALRNRSLVPEKDPRLAESLAFENA